MGERGAGCFRRTRGLVGALAALSGREVGSYGPTKLGGQALGIFHMRKKSRAKATVIWRLAEVKRRVQIKIHNAVGAEGGGWADSLLGGSTRKERTGIEGRFTTLRGRPR